MLSDLINDTQRLQDLHLVPIPMDRNNKALRLECHACYAQRLHSIFLADPLRYHLIPHSPSHTLSRVRVAFFAANLHAAFVEGLIGALYSGHLIAAPLATRPTR